VQDDTERLRHELQSCQQRVVELQRAIDDAHEMVIKVYEAYRMQDSRLYDYIYELRDFLESQLKTDNSGDSRAEMQKDDSE
jgi:hypothetical protein